MNAIVNRLSKGSAADLTQWIGVLGMLFIVIVSVWDLGGVTARSLWMTSIGCICVCAVCLIHLICHHFESQSDPLAERGFGTAASGFAVVAFLFVAYGWLQSVPQPSFLPIAGLNHSAAALVDSLEHEALELQRSADFGDPPQLVPKADRATYGSIVPHRSRLTSAIWINVFSLIVCSIVLMRQRQPRIVFASGVVINSVLIVIWSFVQRSGGSEMILPGVPLPINASPYGSFLYKNAGAASLAPAIFLMVAYVWLRIRSAKSDCSPAVLNVTTLTCVTIVLLLFTGLAISLSRGMLTAVIIALLSVIFVQRDLQIDRMMSALVAVSAAAVGMVVALSNAGGETLERLGSISVSHALSDGRLEHWPDGIAAAHQYLWLGSGVGTYRFATLPNQLSVHRSWYQHAHNQYLETLVESGLPGLFCLLAVIVLLGRAFLQACRTTPGRNRTQRHDHRLWSFVGWGLFGFSLVASLYDFVVIVPANAYVFACILVTALVATAPKAKHAGSSSPDPSRLERFGSIGCGDWLPKIAKVAVVPVLIGCSTVLLIWAIGVGSGRQTSAAALAKTSLAGTRQQAPTQTRIDSCIATLNQAIARVPTDAELFRRRSQWNHLRFRTALQEVAGRATGQSDEAEIPPLPWLASAGGTLQHTLLSLNASDRDRLIADIRESPSTAMALMAEQLDLAAAIRQQPFIAGYYQTSLSRIPLVNVPAEPLLKQSYHVSRNDENLLLEGGRLALLLRENESAISHLHDRLLLRQWHLDWIISTALRSIRAEEIAARMIPRSHPEWVFNLALSMQQLPTQSEGRREQTLTNLIDYLEERSAEGDDLYSATCWATIADLNTLLHDPQAAIEAWQLAVSKNPRSASYRFSLAQQLGAIGRDSESITQARFGAAIAPGDKRFETIIRTTSEKIRR